MIELAVLNVAVLTVLAVLPQRKAVRPEQGRRTAKTLLRRSSKRRATLGEYLAVRARGAGQNAWSLIGPESAGSLPRVGRSAVVLPAAALLALALGGPGAERPVAPSGAECALHEKGGDARDAPAEIIVPETPTTRMHLVVDRVLEEPSTGTDGAGWRSDGSGTAYGT